MAKSASNTTASVRQRLLNLREQRGEDYNAILTQYAVERFLYRLSKSSLASCFVLKGAMLFRVWTGKLHRPTKDLDLLGRGDATPAAVAHAVLEVVATAVPDDGLAFEAQSIVAAEIRLEQEYGGIRVKLNAMLGSARIPMQIDVGFGDAITPEARVHAFPTLLEMDAPRLRMYPPQTVVAEKLEIIVNRGLTNSRMKDYYDLLVILRTHEMTDASLAEAIDATFTRRRTPIPDILPPGLSDAFGTDSSVTRLWREFLKRLQIEDAPKDLSIVVSAIRDRAWPLMLLARALTRPLPNDGSADAEHTPAF